MSNNRRKSKWAPGGLQRKIVVTTLSMCLVIVLTNVQFGVLGLSWIKASNVQSVDSVIQRVDSLIWTQMGLTIVAAIPLSLWVGLSFFKICGPLVNFNNFFTELAAGNWRASCNIRKRDSLQQLNASINAGVDTLLEKIRRQDGLLERAQAELGRLSAGGDGDADEALYDSLVDERAETRERFGESAGDTSQAAEVASEVPAC